MRTMNKKLITLMVAALALLSARGQVSFTGVGEHPVIEVTPETTTGLNKIYVVFDTDGVGMTFNSSTGEPATWESYDYHDGHLEMEPIPGVRWNGMETTLPQVIPNIGYKITEGTTPYFCWVVNYADYYLELNAMTENSEAPCNLITINVDGHGDAIPYYTTNGLLQVLDREIKLNYNTLVANKFGFEQSINELICFDWIICEPFELGRSFENTTMPHGYSGAANKVLESYNVFQQLSLRLFVELLDFWCRGSFVGVNENT